MSNADIYARVTDSMVAALEKGTVPWHRPWQAASGLPMRMNARTGYRGINIMILWSTAQDHGYDSAWWGTYKHIISLGGQVRAGERSTAVLLWKPCHRTATTDGESHTETYLLARVYRVFNAGQADWPAGLPAFMAPPVALSQDERVKAAEEILSGYSPAAGGGPAYAERGNQAFYDPARDRIECPPYASFESPESYYSARFHEMVHSTGHASRLDRPGVSTLDHFGSDRYGQEELVAQMGAAFLCAVAGISAQTEQASAAYLASWVKTLKGDPALVVHAAAAAQRAADRILGTSYENGTE